MFAPIKMIFACIILYAMYTYICFLYIFKLALMHTMFLTRFASLLTSRKYTYTNRSLPISCQFYYKNQKQNKYCYVAGIHFYGNHFLIEFMREMNINLSMKIQQYNRIFLFRAFIYENLFLPEYIFAKKELIWNHFQSESEYYIQCG